jgi:hypothetical protein
LSKKANNFKIKLFYSNAKTAQNIDFQPFIALRSPFNCPWITAPFALIVISFHEMFKTYEKQGMFAFLEIPSTRNGGGMKTLHPLLLP